ncbi:uncharacterized protein VTP21DRAFT_4913 [Calcarisporiella thermophila]|uniref:uncharacterized protein n=1 Tax=Calcarisporiella thermophila TaxID=911321 RepID=UPI0037434C58
MYEMSEKNSSFNTPPPHSQHSPSHPTSFTSLLSYESIPRIGTYELPPSSTVSAADTAKSQSISLSAFTCEDASPMNVAADGTSTGQSLYSRNSVVLPSNTPLSPYYRRHSLPLYPVLEPTAATPKPRSPEVLANLVFPSNTHHSATPSNAGEKAMLSPPTVSSSPITPGSAGEGAESIRYARLYSTPNPLDHPSFLGFSPLNYGQGHMMTLTPSTPSHPSQYNSSPSEDLSSFRYLESSPSAQALPTQKCPSQKKKAIPDPSMMLTFNSKIGTSPLRRYPCSVCQKRFSRPSSLATHMHSHTGQKPFRCPVEGCGRCFSVQSNLRRHIKIHFKAGRPSPQTSTHLQRSEDHSQPSQPSPMISWQQRSGVDIDFQLVTMRNMDVMQNWRPLSQSPMQLELGMGEVFSDRN